MANYTNTPEEIKQMIDDRIVVEAGCWVWNGRLTRGGYGSINLSRDDYPTEAKKLTQSAHKVSYETHKGRVPDGLVLDHLCRNRACVNPNHLEAVTQEINLIRGVDTIYAKNKYKTECIRGHSLKGDNVYEPPKRPGRRYCKKCQNIRQKERIAS